MAVVGFPHEADNTEQVYSQQECKQCRSPSDTVRFGTDSAPHARSAFFSPTPIIKLKLLSLIFVIKSVTVI